MLCRICREVEYPETSGRKICRSKIMSFFDSCSMGISLSNIQRFLQCVTPIIPSTPLSKSCYSDLNSQWQPLGESPVEYFTLKELWDCYYEWSALGVGTEVTLSNGESVMQYYVPFLSAIQLFSSKSVVASRNQKDDIDGGVDIEVDSSSDGSGSDDFSKSPSNNSSKGWDAVSEDSSWDQESSWPTRDRLGYPYLQYMEMSSPYTRVPLTDKIVELARSYPRLMTFKSVDLSPASWMAVAWYLIYHIPTQKNEKDLETCFLTFHTLSSSFQDIDMEYDDINIGQDYLYWQDALEVDEEESKKQNSDSILIRPFGLASYKMKGDVWMQEDSGDEDRLVHLYSAADSWLKQLNVNHHDFNFFNLQSTL